MSTCCYWKQRNNMTSVAYNLRCVCDNCVFLMSFGKLCKNFSFCMSFLVIIFRSDWKISEVLLFFLVFFQTNFSLSCLFPVQQSSSFVNVVIKLTNFQTQNSFFRSKYYFLFTALSVSQIKHTLSYQSGWNCTNDLCLNNLKYHMGTSLNQQLHLGLSLIVALHLCYYHRLVFTVVSLFVKALKANRPCTMFLRKKWHSHLSKKPYQIHCPSHI